MATLLGLAFALVFFGTLVYRLLALKRRPARSPPGPAPWPIIGNIPHLPRPGSLEYAHWLDHKDKYGPISSVNIMGQSMLILHDYEAARDLLEKQSRVTSSRPVMEFAHNIAGYGGYITSQSYNDTFRDRRKLAHQQLGTMKLVEQYSSIQQEEVGHMLQRMLDEPQKMVQHFQNEAGAIILRMTYGYNVEKQTADPLVRLVDRMMANFSEAFMPLAWPVDAITSLKHLPDWLPGMSFKKIGKEWNLINQLCIDIPYSFTKQEMALNKHTNCLVSKMIHTRTHGDVPRSLQPQDEEAIKWAAATLYGGGAETSVSALSSFVLAMVKFPEVQKRAQEEIDRVVGPGRLPQFEDRPNLPYINAVVMETLRWIPVTGLGVPHRTDADIEYRGYHIPKGTIIIASIWWFLHDPQVYKDPDTFEPTRYFAPRNEPDPDNACFGFGRRVCPGRYVADSSIFLNIAQLLACFSMEKALDEQGQPMEPRVGATPGIVSHPEKFLFNIVPRSAAHVDLVKSIRQERSFQEGDSSRLEGVDLIEKVLA